ncbi:MAG: hypothetical protein ACREBG_25665 [Pyrinomonadaceae bacterium]
MITGFNTDVEHEGVVYHVQTEDKGLESPLILSLVYSGGAILASKRSRYEDLIASGFSDEALAERLKRQHRLICAAILAGRLEELKRMGGQTGPLVLDPERAKLVTGATGPLPPSPQKTDRVAAPPPQADQPDIFASQDQRHHSPLGELPMAEGLQVILLEDQEFRSGNSLVLRIMVRHQSGTEDKPINGAAVSVKVLGTTFRPQIYSVKTQKDGIAVVPAEIPKFSSGRAAILIRVLANGRETEMRRVIHAA